MKTIEIAKAMRQKAAKMKQDARECQKMCFPDISSSAKNYKRRAEYLEDLAEILEQFNESH